MTTTEAQFIRPSGTFSIGGVSGTLSVESASGIFESTDVAKDITWDMTYWVTFDATDATFDTV